MIIIDIQSGLVDLGGQAIPADCSALAGAGVCRWGDASGL